MVLDEFRTELREKDPASIDIPVLRTILESYHECYSDQMSKDASYSPLIAQCPGSHTDIHTDKISWVTNKHKDKHSDFGPKHSDSHRYNY